MNKTINQAYNVYFLYKMRYNVVIRVGSPILQETHCDNEELDIHFEI